jgi:hypothetical protein
MKILKFELPSLFKNNSTVEAILQEIRQCAEMSTVHAVTKILKSKNLAVKLFMFFCLLVSTGFCVSFLVQSFSNYGVITSIRAGYVTSIEFPMISFCNSNRSNPNVTDFFKWCYFIGTKCHYEQDLSYFRDPSFGDCYRFNSGENMKGESVPIKKTNTAWVHGSISFNLFTGTSKNDYVVMFISNEKVNSNDHEYQVFSSGRRNLIGLSKTVIQQYPKPYSYCTQDLISISSYSSQVYQKTFDSYPNNSYKYSNCVNMCQQKLIGEICLLQANWLGPKYYDNLPYNSSDCVLPNLKEFSDEYLETCDCPRECNSVQFTYSSSSLFSKDLDESNNVEFLIFFSEMKVTSISESPKYQIQDLVANFGGNLGLFLGASFLSVAEFFELLIVIFWIVIYRMIQPKVKNINESVEVTISNKIVNTNGQNENDEIGGPLDLSRRLEAIRNENKKLVREMEQLREMISARRIKNDEAN